MDESINKVRVEIYRSFIDEQRAPSLTELARTLEMSEPDVGSALRTLHDRDVIALRPGSTEIWLAHPFCAVDAPFEVRSGDRRWDGICIWDALGILALVDIDGEVSTECPDCGTRIVLYVRQGQLEGDDELVVHYGVPAARWYEDVAYT